MPFCSCVSLFGRRLQPCWTLGLVGSIDVLPTPAQIQHIKNLLHLVFPDTILKIVKERLLDLNLYTLVVPDDSSIHGTPIRMKMGTIVCSAPGISKHQTSDLVAFAVF